MTTETLLPILVVALIAGMALTAVVAARVRRGRAHAATDSAPGSVEPASGTRSAQSGPSGTDLTSAAAAAPGAAATARSTSPGNSPPNTPVPNFRPEPGILLDPVTGLDNRTAWDEAIRHEDARLGRYHRAATVVVTEIEGLDALGQRLGYDVADGLILPVADTLRRNARSSDRVAHVAPARFHVLMPETDEVSAINYVERIRAQCDLWLESGALAVRLAIGWAGPPTGDTLYDIVRAAEERMNADRRRPAAPRPPAARPDVSRPPAPAVESELSASDMDRRQLGAEPRPLAS